jgi:hypothetical protein
MGWGKASLNPVNNSKSRFRRGVSVSKIACPAFANRVGHPWDLVFDHPTQHAPLNAVAVQVRMIDIHRTATIGTCVD